jgi:hypothetical protein
MIAIFLIFCISNFNFLIEPAKIALFSIPKVVKSLNHKKMAVFAAETVKRHAGCDEPIWSYSAAVSAKYGKNITAMPQR